MLSTPAEIQRMECGPRSRKPRDTLLALDKVWTALGFCSDLASGVAAMHAMLRWPGSCVRSDLSPRTCRVMSSAPRSRAMAATVPWLRTATRMTSSRAICGHGGPACHKQVRPPCYRKCYMAVSGQGCTGCHERGMMRQADLLVKSEPGQNTLLRGFSQYSLLHTTALGTAGDRPLVGSCWPT